MKPERGWGWMTVSAFVTFALGIMILKGWPEAWRLMASRACSISPKSACWSRACSWARRIRSTYCRHWSMKPSTAASGFSWAWFRKSSSWWQMVLMICRP